MALCLAGAVGLDDGDVLTLWDGDPGCEVSDEE